jgi:tRNA threonylcarbamoyladenosine biosynthesis protein TsaB
MNILAFDTCFGACSAAVGQDVLGPFPRVHSTFEAMETGHAERLVPMIAEVLEAAGVSMSAITRIAVTTGPGTFTGTRIGLAAARSLALGGKAETVGVSSLVLMAQTALGLLARPSFETQTAVVVDARRDQFYFQLFGADGLDPKSEPALISLDEAAQVGEADKPILFVGSGADVAAEAAKVFGRKATAALPDLLPDAKALLAIATAAKASAEPLMPLYMRPPDAKPQTGKTLLRAE